MLTCTGPLLTSAQARHALRSVIAFYVHHTFGAVTVTVTLILFLRLNNIKVTFPNIVKGCILRIQATEREPEQNSTNSTQGGHGSVVPHQQWVYG